jgi:serine/threonine protein kinase
VAEHDLIGEVLADRYRVEHRLGQGGMGSVWQVQHVESLQHFALKVLHRDVADDARATVRLLREAQATASLNSRHVVRVVDSNIGYRHAGRAMPFLVMELLRGATLEELSKGRPLTAGQTSWVFSQLVRALSLAHQRGIVHRDLKPSNVFVALGDDDEALVKLCDFGMAKWRKLGAVEDSNTRSGEFLGTPRYMSPEQLRDSKNVGAATDQWALGLLAFRLLSGKDYFAGALSTADLVAAVLASRMEAPSLLVPQLGESFDPWFLRSCAPTPEQRWPDVLEQTHALQAALGQPQPEEIRPEPPRPIAANIAIKPFPLPQASRRDVRVPSLPLLVTASLGLIGLMWLTTRWGLDSVIATAEATSSVSATSTGSVVLGAEPSATSEQQAMPLSVDATPKVTVVTATSATSSAPQTQETTKAPPSKPKPPRVAAPPPKPAASNIEPEPRLLPAGAPCQRSTECQSRLCFAEQCQ